MKLLVVSSYLPYPLLDGGRVRLFNLLKILGKEHEITLICEKWPPQTQKDVDEVKKICSKVLVFDRPRAMSIKNISKSIFSFNPLLTTVHSNKKFKKMISDELKINKYDLIHVETFYVFNNLPKTNIPKILVEHNLEYKVYERYVEKKKPFLRPFFLPDLMKLKRSEISTWSKADKLVSVSPVEQKIMGKNTEIVPNGVDLIKFKIKKNKNITNKKKILFIGNFKWLQNRDSAIYIIKNVWPKILLLNKNNQDLKLWIVGKNIPKSIKDLASESIVFDENAPDETELIFQNSDVLLAPIRVGGGTSYKILESIASGTPVVTTFLGNEGIGAEDGNEIFLAEKPDEIADKVIKLLNDEYIYEKISRNGRKFIENNYDWIKIAEKLNLVYRRALNK